MQTCEGRIERVFVIRLEDGDQLPECIERFAEEKGIKAGHLVIVGDIGGGRVVVGPQDAATMPPEIMILPISGVSEVVGVGVLAPDEGGKTKLHLHAALGRSGQTMTGCLRYGVSTWQTAEVILYEIGGIGARRIRNKDSGFELLEIEDIGKI